MCTITKETGVLLPPSDSCSAGYRDSDDAMDIVQLRSSSSSADLISAHPYQQGIYRRGMTDTPVKFLGSL
jgi:hypothetical protein